MKRIIPPAFPGAALSDRLGGQRRLLPVYDQPMIY
jgi:hypothetical protein